MDARNKRFYDALAVACPLAPTPAHSSRRATLGTLRVASAKAAVVPSSQAIVSRIAAYAQAATDYSAFVKLVASVRVPRRCPRSWCKVDCHGSCCMLHATVTLRCVISVPRPTARSSL